MRSPHTAVIVQDWENGTLVLVKFSSNAGISKVAIHKVKSPSCLG